MNNNEILKNRWAEVDKQLSAFLKKYQKLNKKTQDKLQQVFDGITFTREDINKYITDKEKEKFKRTIEEYDDKGLLDGYFGYQCKLLLRRSRIKYSEMLEILIVGCYMEEKKSLDELENNLFKEISQHIYETGYREAKSKDKKHHILPEVLLATAISLPNSRGYVWKEYTEGNAEYNGGQIKRQVIINMQQGKVLDIEEPEFQKIITSQNKRYLNKKKDQNQVDKYSGMLDEEVAYLTNVILLESYKRAGIEKVKFVAVYDEKTTDMCKSLDNQIFAINDWNTFDRYSGADDKNVIYKVHGLKVGDNLPPINNNFHWCRSTIYPSE